MAASAVVARARHRHSWQKGQPGEVTLSIVGTPQVRQPVLRQECRCGETRLRWAGEPVVVSAGHGEAG